MIPWISHWLSREKLKKGAERTHSGLHATRSVYDRLYGFSSHLLKVALLVFGLVILVRVVHSQLATGYVLQQVQVPSKKMLSAGMSADVVTALIAERIAELQESANDNGGLSPGAGTAGLRREERAEIEIPGTGIKLDEFIALMGQALPFGPREITVSLSDTEESLNASIRVKGRPLKVISQPLQPMENARLTDICPQTPERCLVDKVASVLTGVIDPLAMALNYRIEGRAVALATLLRDYQRYELENSHESRVTLETLRGIHELAQARHVDGTTSDALLAQAYSSFERALDLDRKNALAWKLLADTATTLGRAKLAEKMYEKAWAASGKDVSVGQRWAYHLATNGKHEAADRKFAEIRDTLPVGDRRRAAVELLWAEAQRDGKRFDLAEPHYAASFQLEPGSAKFFASRGTHRLREYHASRTTNDHKKEYARKALSDFNQAVALSERLPGWTYANRGLAQQEVGLLRAAVSSFEQAAKAGLPPWAKTDWLALLNKNWAATPERELGYRRYLRSFPNSVAGHAQLLKLLINEYDGKSPKVTQQIEESLWQLRGSSTEAELLNTVAAAMETRNQPEQALEYANRALRHDEHYHSAYVYKAVALAKLGQPQRALRVIETGAATLQEPPMGIDAYSLQYQAAYFNGAGARLRRSSPALAARLLKRSEEIFPYSAWTSLNRISSLLELNRYDEAEQEMQRALAFIEKRETPPASSAGSWGRAGAAAGTYFRSGLLQLAHCLCTEAPTTDDIRRAAKSFRKAVTSSKGDAEYYRYALTTALLQQDSDAINLLLIAAERQQVIGTQLNTLSQLIDSSEPELPTLEQLLENGFLSRPEVCPQGSDEQTTAVTSETL